MTTESKTPIKSGRRNTGTIFPTQARAAKDKAVEIMQFPSDLGAHQFIMNFVKFTLAGKGGQPNTDVISSIALPIPGQGITDKIGVKYNQDELGIVGGSLLGAVASAANAAERAAALDPVKLTGEDAVKGLLETAGGATRAAINEVGMGVGGAADQAFGNVVNPHVVLLFKNVDLKTFTLQWKLAPATADESKTLQMILNKIREHAHPRQQSDMNKLQHFLNYPDQVDLYYEGVGEYLHYFKRSAITGMDINYQPEGENLFFAGTKAPARIDLSLTFQETEIWTAEDYASSEIR